MTIGWEVWTAGAGLDFVRIAGDYATAVEELHRLGWTEDANGRWRAPEKVPLHLKRRRPCATANDPSKPASA
jgi:hypothetical protein